MIAIAPKPQDLGSPGSFIDPSSRGKAGSWIGVCHPRKRGHKKRTCPVRVCPPWPKGQAGRWHGPCALVGNPRGRAPLHPVTGERDARGERIPNTTTPLGFPRAEVVRTNRDTPTPLASGGSCPRRTGMGDHRSCGGGLRVRPRACGWGIPAPSGRGGCQRPTTPFGQ